MTILNLQVAASTDDADLYYNSGWNIQLTGNNVFAGSGLVPQCGTGFRFLNVVIPKAAIITSAYLQFIADQAQSGTIVKSRITGDLEANAATFSTIADYQSRRGTDVGGANNNKRTVAQVTWDNIAAWAANTTYNSPDISPIIQEIINQSGWASGNAIALFWDDHEGRSSGAALRSLYSYDGSSSQCAVLHIEYIKCPFKIYNFISPILAQ